MKIFSIFKKNLLTLVFFLFLVFLVIFSNENLIATKDGLNLWAKNVVPSLLPFFIATELLNYTNITSIFKRIFNKFMRPLFNVPGEGAYAFFMGIISGYPVGAKIVCNLYESKKCTKEEAERMLAFSNNSGPLFIIGTVGVLLFGNTTVGFLLFTTHILSSITVGILLGILSRIFCNHIPKKENLNSSIRNSSIASLSNLGNIISTSITKAIQTTLLIGGFIVFFSVVLQILKKLNIISNLSNILYIFFPLRSVSEGIITGIIELTNGACIISRVALKNISTNITIVSFLLGFGGISVLLQVVGIISKYGLSIKIYLWGKILQGLIASYYTYSIIHSFKIFNYDIPNNSYISYPYLLIISLIILSISFIVKHEISNHNKIHC